MQYKINIIVFALLFSITSIGQEKVPFYKSYSWSENPTYSSVGFEDEPLVSLKDKIVTEFFFEDQNLVEYYIEHRVLWLNSDEKIEDYNKIYLPYNNNSTLLVNKARVMNKDGEIIELDDSKILTAKDEETNQHYKYFAFEGVEKGSFIEYYYVLKRKPKYKGRRVTFQSSYLKNNVEFDLFSPKNLVFEFKSYNQLSPIVQDTIIKNKLHWHIQAEKIAALDHETLSAYHASKKFLIYKLDKNTANNTTDISSYGNVAQNLYTYYYTEYDKKTKANIQKFINEANIDINASKETTIRKIEFFIKTSIYHSENDGEGLSDLNKVLTKKVADEYGIMKLYIALFRTLKIKHELVITSDRRELKFDQSFESTNFLTNYLFYFPKTKTYLSPEENDSRYGFPPAYLTDNYGYFIKEVAIGDFKSGIGKIKYIKPVKAKESFDKMILDVTFDKDDMTKNYIKLDRSLNGYYSMVIQPFINLVKDDDRDELMDGFAKQINESITITNKKLVNDDPELFGIKPLQFLIDIESEAFVEKAGRKYLFKLGELIGPQMELYQEKERILTLENEFERSYFRTINIEIPEGYKVVNLEDININNSFKKNGKELLSFNSFYEFNNNILTITADEHYKMNIIEVENYEAYRIVINSAADFNKITLILEPIE